MISAVKIARTIKQLSKPQKAALARIWNDGGGALDGIDLGERPRAPELSREQLEAQIRHTETVYRRAVRSQSWDDEEACYWRLRELAAYQRRLEARRKPGD